MAGGRFEPGVSGNPGGRPSVREVAAIARRYTPDALRALVEVCRTAIDNPAARVAAANGLLDRGWGKPNQQLDVTGGVGQALHLHLYAVQRLEQVREVAGDLDAPPIDGTAAEFADFLLPPSDERLPEEALPLWDAAVARRTAAPEPDQPPALGPEDTEMPP
ncbi:MAG TPA: hypothetical protein VN681_12315 [Stellaceae bacterium]|nr:hypothetical protein [Stellaceae bacterium]